MPELTLGSDDDESTSGVGEITLDDLVDQAVRNVQQNPDTLATLADVMESKGVDPSLLGLVDPKAPEVVKEVRKHREAVEGGTDTGKVEATENGKMLGKSDVDADKLLELIDELCEYMDDDPSDFTIEDMREYIEDNKDVVDTALKLKL